MAETNEAELVADARTRIREIAAAEAIAQRGGDALFVDVRELNEWNLFRIPGARHIPFGELAGSADRQVPRDRDVIVYCNKGNRSVLAADVLRTLGYSRVVSLAGGVSAWMDAGGELED